MPEDPTAKAQEPSPSTRTRVSSFSNSSPSTVTTSPQFEAQQPRAFRGRPSHESVPTLVSGSPEMILNSSIKRRDPGAPRLPIRKSSAAEQILERFQLQPRAGTIAGPRTSPMKARDDTQSTFPRTTIPKSRRNSLTAFFNFANSQNQAGPPSPHAPRPRFSRSPSAPHSVPQIQTSNSQGSVAGSTITVIPELLPLLDGEHHTDELATRFQVGWPLLEQWLIAAGGGKGDGDFGRVLIIYR